MRYIVRKGRQKTKGRREKLIKPQRDAKESFAERCGEEPEKRRAKKREDERRKTDVGR